MGLSGWFAGRALRATRVLVVEGGGGFSVRVAVERAARGRGWRTAESPASADALVVAGGVGEELGTVVEGVWDAMPGPRARAVVLTVEDVDAALDDLAGALADGRGQALDAESRTAPDLSSDGDGHGGMDHEGHGGMDQEGHGGMDHEGHGGMDHEGHEGMEHSHMGHGDMDMAPDGIPLAEGSDEDRDGLEMDALPVRLGPVLPHWPAGLVLDLALHGDLVVEASARLLDEHESHTSPEDAPATRAARRCDEVAALLALAGAVEAEQLARSARDALLDHRGDDARALLVDVRHRLEHSRLLAWSLRGVGVIAPQRAEELGLPPEVSGDCRDRLLRLVERAIAAAHSYAGTADGDDVRPAVVPVARWGALVRDCDVAVARLVVATLGTPTPTSEREGARHG